MPTSRSSDTLRQMAVSEEWSVGLLCRSGVAFAFRCVCASTSDDFPVGVRECLLFNVTGREACSQERISSLLSSGKLSRDDGRQPVGLPVTARFRRLSRTAWAELQNGRTFDSGASATSSRLAAYVAISGER